MSSDGSRVIIGADWNDGTGDKSGHAHIFEEVNGTDWKQVGHRQVRQRPKSLPSARKPVH